MVFYLSNFRGKIITVIIKDFDPDDEETTLIFDGDKTIWRFALPAFRGKEKGKETSEGVLSVEGARLKNINKDIIKLTRENGFEGKLQIPFKR
jgi:hypothetical protein